eukprot:scaffold3091_cov349-Prasinococcus_capsulatus_cf.AAC.4
MSLRKSRRLQRPILAIGPNDRAAGAHNPSVGAAAAVPAGALAERRVAQRATTARQEGDKPVRIYLNAGRAPSWSVETVTWQPSAASVSPAPCRLEGRGLVGFPSRAARVRVARLRARSSAFKPDLLTCLIA